MLGICQLLLAGGKKYWHCTQLHCILVMIWFQHLNSANRYPHPNANSFSLGEPRNLDSAIYKNRKSVWTQCEDAHVASICQCKQPWSPCGTASISAYSRARAAACCSMQRTPFFVQGRMAQALTTVLLCSQPCASKQSWASAFRRDVGDVSSLVSLVLKQAGSSKFIRTASPKLRAMTSENPN